MDNQNSTQNLTQNLTQKKNDQIKKCFEFLEKEKETIIKITTKINFSPFVE